MCVLVRVCVSEHKNTFTLFSFTHIRLVRCLQLELREYDSAFAVDEEEKKEEEDAETPWPEVGPFGRIWTCSH